ncbi:MAG: hypothetical protein J5J00_02100 [Deltaproteobacteria bacterium]|nr:hypothetical protein [Deltaproteobacteria bacterium]
MEWLKGRDRIELRQELGRPIRLGAPSELAVSDAERVRTLIRSGDAAAAKDFFGLLHPIYSAVVSTFLEWALAMPNVLAAMGHEARVSKVLSQSYNWWLEGEDAATSVYPAAALLKEIFSPENISTKTVVSYREEQTNGVSQLGEQLLGPVNNLYQEVLRLIDEDCLEPAVSSFEVYLREVRLRHDLIGQYVSSAISAIADIVNQTIAEDVMQEALESCALLKGMWSVFEKLPPEALAATLAEHLRAHYSGEGRQGAVQIIEEKDCFRLIFEPCGTGGAMRQGKVPGLRVLKEASPATWSLANQVPSYCAHCAKNEITSIEKMGYPAWVTEFNPDPDKPCGWTVYKDPALIPERYFARLGLSKGDILKK